MAARKKVQEGPLPSFEGKQVVAAAVKITRAGDGLSEALKVAPEALHDGDEVWFVLKGEVTQVTHRRIAKAEGLLARVHVVEAREIVKVDGVAVLDLMKAEQERILLLKEEAAGVTRLDFDDDPLGVGGDEAPEQ